MSNETKRDVFETFADECAGLNDEIYKRFLKQYDDALPDNLPVIPNYVAEYIDAEKNNNDVIQAGIDAIEYSKGSIELTTWIEENGDTFARAWLDSYTVEVEK